MRKKKIGIVNKGKVNQYVDNHFNGYDIGIQDEGEDTIAKGNRFNLLKQQNAWYEIWWVRQIYFR